MNGNNNPAGPAPLPSNENQGAFSGSPRGAPGPNKPTPPPPPPPPPRQRPTEGGAPPPPPAAEIDIRTLASDTSSLKSTGGTGTEPKVFKPSDLSKESSFDASVSVDAVKRLPTSRKKAALIATAVAILIGVVAATVYIFVLPLFQSDEPEVVIPEDNTADTGSQLPKPRPAFEHTSFFTVSPDATVEVVLDEVTSGEINAAVELVTESDETRESGSTHEIVFTTADGAPLTAEDILSVLLPGLSSSFFVPDFTGFTYYDGNGTWPGYIFMLDESADGDGAGSSVAAEIEDNSDTNLALFYLTPPGQQDSGGFQDGVIGSVATRYLPFSGQGASFNYGWVNRHLVISTSFGGFQEVVRLLQE